jgi:hypothetical protein
LDLRYVFHGFQSLLFKFSLYRYLAAQSNAALGLSAAAHEPRSTAEAQEWAKRDALKAAKDVWKNKEDANFATKFVVEKEAGVTRTLTQVGLALHSRGCQIGYVDRTGCRQLVSWLPLPGVRLVTWTIPAVTNQCFDRHSWGVSDWLRGPSEWLRGLSYHRLGFDCNITRVKSANSTRRPTWGRASTRCTSRARRGARTRWTRKCAWPRCSSRTAPAASCACSASSSRSTSRCGQGWVVTHSRGVSEWLHETYCPLSSSTEPCFDCKGLTATF